MFTLTFILRRDYLSNILDIKTRTPRREYDIEYF